MLTKKFNILKTLIIAAAIIMLSSISLYSQYEENKGKEILNWTLLQLIPNPVLIQEQNETDARLNFGFRWQVIPVNVSFSANKFITPVQFFKINPVRRFAGSVELFVQPEWTTGNFKYATLDRFGISSGLRAIFPVREKGESMAFSIGAKVNYRNDNKTNENTFIGLEQGIYFVGGLIGIQINQNFSKHTKFNFGIFIKYY